MKKFYTISADKQNSFIVFCNKAQAKRQAKNFAKYDKAQNVKVSKTTLADFYALYERDKDEIVLLCRNVLLNTNI